MHHFFPKSELGNFGVFLDQMRDKTPSKSPKTTKQNNKTTKQQSKNNKATQKKCDSATVPQCQPTLRSIA